MLDDRRALEIVLPKEPGVGFKHLHFEDLLNDRGCVSWLEIHAENYMSDGGRKIAQLNRLRQDFPISCHGVGLSIGGENPLSKDHLNRLEALVSWLEPASFSEHLAWSSHGGSYFNDLLPVPYTKAALQRVCEHIDEVQNILGRTMLLENPSTYLVFEESEMTEIEFISDISRRTGCGLLLDVNNVFVSSTNHSVNPYWYIDEFPLHSVGEIHLGGHAEDSDDEGALLLIDNHGSEVAEPVWDLYEHVLRGAGALPTLIEWDSDVPEWKILEAEADRAFRLMNIVQDEYVGLP
ncbi:MAG: DUF692 domain-containing protein [Albidovulum sp.]|nr:DUF692 domain-containing protein [Albidovulum sp.]MDE0306482.1 DUF692 domain-containing protein [Albidovulum sp.]MDE0531258.1 DUF692 domain-containing protein [Albidovulum sp.]